MSEALAEGGAGWLEQEIAEGPPRGQARAAAEAESTAVTKTVPALGPTCPVSHHPQSTHEGPQEAAEALRRGWGSGELGASSDCLDPHWEFHLSLASASRPNHPTGAERLLRAHS